MSAAPPANYSRSRKVSSTGRKRTERLLYLGGLLAAFAVGIIVEKYLLARSLLSLSSDGSSAPGTTTSVRIESALLRKAPSPSLRSLDCPPPSPPQYPQTSSIFPSISRPITTTAAVATTSSATSSSTDARKQLSAAFRRMSTRGELPQLLNELGLLGEGMEVGVRNGEFSKWILQHWRGSKMHMVDPWEHQDEKLYKDISNRDQGHQDKLYNDLQSFMKANYPKRFELHRGYSVQVAAGFPNDSLDFIYLDARHDYEGVKEDLHAWWDKLKQGGVYAGHDFVPDGDIPAGRFGVQKAVWEFAMLKNREYLSISSKMPHGGREEPQRVDGGWTTWYMIK